MKPKCKFTGADGNVFNLIAIASRALRKEGMRKEEKEMQERVFASESYDHALRIMMEYVEVC